MAGVYKLEITETEADLKQRLRHAKTASDKERLQLLYLLKSGQASTIQSAATLLFPAFGDGLAEHQRVRMLRQNVC
jgi:aromatic ring hydroxylase